MTTPAERVRAYLQARASFRAEEALQRRNTPGQVIDSEFDYTTHKYVDLLEEDLRSLLPPENPGPEYIRIDDILDKPPVAQCTRCGRKTWSSSEVNTEDRMTQPDGQPCGGFLEAL